MFLAKLYSEKDWLATAAALRTLLPPPPCSLKLSFLAHMMTPLCIQYFSSFLKPLNSNSTCSPYARQLWSFMHAFHHPFELITHTHTYINIYVHIYMYAIDRELMFDPAYQNSVQEYKSSSILCYVNNIRKPYINATNADLLIHAHNIIAQGWGLRRGTCPTKGGRTGATLYTTSMGTIFRTNNI